VRLAGGASRRGALLTHILRDGGGGIAASLGPFSATVA
jgi:hypothetical protein